MPTIKITIDGKAYDLPLPNGMTLRQQNPDCNNKGCICATMNKNLVCCKLTLKSDKDGSFEFFEMNPCSKNKNKVIMEI